MPITFAPGAPPLLLIAAEVPSGVRTELVTEAARRRVGVLRLDAARSIRSIDGAVGACAAGAVAVCGPGWMQARVATVACGRGLPFGCVPYGEQDLLARDLGACWEDPAESLCALLEGDEQVLDLGEVNGVTFVNYVAIADRDGGGRAQFEPLGLDPPDAVLVSNNQFTFHGGQLGGRERLDGGLLDLAVRRGGAPGWQQAKPAASASNASFTRLELCAEGSVLADVDGWPRVLSTPLRFRVLVGALRVLIQRAA